MGSEAQGLPLGVRYMDLGGSGQADSGSECVSPVRAQKKQAIGVWALGRLLHKKAPSQGGLLLSLGNG